MPSRINIGPDTGPFVELDEENGELVIRVPEDEVNFDQSDLRNVKDFTAGSVSTEHAHTDALYPGDETRLQGRDWSKLSEIGYGEEPDRRPLMTITYDDDSKYIYDHAFPVHQSEEVPGIYYVISGFIEGEGTAQWGPSDSWDRLREMHNTPLDEGMIEIADHTIDHNDVTNKDADELIQDTLDSIALFRENGILVQHHAYPYGSQNAEVRNIYQRFFVSSRDTGSGFEDYSAHPHELNCDGIDSKAVSSVKSNIDDAVANDEWYSILLHDVHPDGEVNGNQVKTPDELEEIIQYAKNQGVEIVTQDEALATFAPRWHHQARDGTVTANVRRDGTFEMTNASVTDSINALGLENGSPTTPEEWIGWGNIDAGGAKSIRNSVAVTDVAGDNTAHDLIDTADAPSGFIVVSGRQTGSSTGFCELVVIGVHTDQQIIGEPAERGTPGLRSYNDDGTMITIAIDDPDETYDVTAQYLGGGK